MSGFQIEKQELVHLVSTAQSRTYSEQIDLLTERGPELQWLLHALNTHPKNGISPSQIPISARITKYGSNQKLEPPLSSFFQHFKQALDDFILKILMVSSVLSIIIQVATADESDRKTAWIDGFVVLIAVAVCSLVTAGNNYSKQRQFKQLNKVADDRKRVTLRREGELMQIHQDQLLVGDIVDISEGMEIPADAIVIQANQITTDESAMTGQTDPIHKNVLSSCVKKKKELQQHGEKNIGNCHQIPSPFLLSGTKVLTGQGKMLILVVGDSSCIGKIRALLTQQEINPTPLQEKLQQIAKDIGKFGLYSAIIILVVLLLRFSIQKGLNPSWNNSTDLPELISYFILSLTVIVVAIPEGLPLSVTLSLAVSVRKMLTDNNLVRKMDACETMGSATTICSDKTGTLTMNKMTLTHIWNQRTVTIDTYNQNLKIQDLTTNKEWTQLFAICSCVNSTANLLPEEKGSSTQIAMLKYFEKVGIKYSDYRDRYPTLMKFPFSSSRKRMSVIVQRDGSQLWMFVKGASQIVLNCCSKWHDMQSNKIQIITQSTKQQMNLAIRKMAQSSLRTLCLAYKQLPLICDTEGKDQKGVFQIQKSQLTLLCIIGVRDVPRMEVPAAIVKCHRAGIKVRMVTGDNLITATAIAKDIGILKDGDNTLVLEGPDFSNRIGGVVCKQCRTKVCECARDSKQAEANNTPLRVDTIQNGSQFDLIIDNLLVLARSRPEDKYALVTGLRERGQIVAVTGDGTNDAPALKKADVGFAMGISGTQTAREAASIILLDDNFNSIVKAVLWGRNIYDSIRKFIQFQLTVNVVAVLITLIGAALLKQQVFAPIQMLWINLIMDTLASLALATEAPTEDLLERQPNRRQEHIVSRNMGKHILGQAALQIVIIIILIFWGENIIPQYQDQYDSTVFAAHPEWKWRNGIIGGNVCSGRLITIGGSADYQTAFNSTGVYSRHFTFIFNTFVMLQIFNFFNCRKIQDQINIFAGITNNIPFIIIVTVIFLLQALLVTLTGTAFHVYSNYGLTVQQWAICIGFGSISLPVNFLLKFIKLRDVAVQDAKVEDERGDPSQQEFQTASNIIKVKHKKSQTSPRQVPLDILHKNSDLAARVKYQETLQFQQ